MFDLKSFRENKMRITQMELAKRMGLGQDQISRIEKNPENMGMDFFLKLCQVAGMSPNDVLNFKLPNPEPLEVRDVYRDLKFNIEALKYYISPEYEKFKEAKGFYPDFQKAIDKVDELFKVIEPLAAKPKIAFLGPSDAGKSRLINVLTGLDVLLSQWTPTTAATVYLKHKSDKPDWMGDEDVWVFKSESEELGWNVNKFKDKDYCERHKLAGGGVEILTTYCNRNNEIAVKNVDSAVVYLNSEILNVCDIVDLPGFGTENPKDTVQSQRAKEQADIVIFLCQSNGFMNKDDDLIFLKNVIQSLPQINKSTNERILSNLLIVASQAHVVGEEEIEKVLYRGYEAISEQLSDEVIQSIAGMFKKDFIIHLKSRFFSYSVDNQNLRREFEVELKRLIEETFPRIINQRVDKAISDFVQDTSETFNTQVLKYQAILNDREKAKSEYDKAVRNKYAFSTQVDFGKSQILSLIERLVNNDKNLFRDWEKQDITVDKIERIISDKKYDKKKAQQYLMSNVTDLYYAKLQELLTNSSVEFDENVRKFFNGLKTTSQEFGKINIDGVDIPFDLQGAIFGGLAGAGVLGALSFMTAGLGNLGGYILVAQGVSILSSLGISVGGTAAAASAVAAIGGPITIALALGFGAFILASWLFGESWQKRFAKKVKGILDSEMVLESYENELKIYWHNTKNAFLSVVNNIVDKYDEHLNVLKDIIENLEPEQVETQIHHCKHITDFFLGIPWGKKYLL